MNVRKRSGMMSESSGPKSIAGAVTQPKSMSPKAIKGAKAWAPKMKGLGPIKGAVTAPGRY